MIKRFGCGLVVGKFSPLHRGHELLIRRALDECEQVVIISYCKPEFAGYEAERRQSWLTTLFPEAVTLVLNDEGLSKLHLNDARLQRLPANDDSPTTHRQFCALLCRDILHVSVDAIFSSESYGKQFAEELATALSRNGPQPVNVEHVMVDQQRLIAPISGTLLRENIHQQRAWLSPEVYRSFVKRVCILGGESTGKSTLTNALAKEFATLGVNEFGRELWELKNGLLEFDDLLSIGRRQVDLEEETAGKANEFLFCDTSPLTTLFYSGYLFGKSETELQELATRSYHLVAVCAPDFPFVQDGTRQPAAFRDQQHEWYLRELAEREISYVLCEGSVAERIEKVRLALSSLEKVTHPIA